MKKRRTRNTTVYDDSHLEQAFYSEWCRRFPFAKPQREHIFHPVRKWRFDFAWTEHKLAVEVMGYGPGHFSLPGYTSDCFKMLAAVKLGWRLIYLTSTFLLPEKIAVTCNSIAIILGLQIQPEPKGYIPINRRNKE